MIGDDDFARFVVGMDGESSAREIFEENSYVFLARLIDQLSECFYLTKEALDRLPVRAEELAPVLLH